jgi:hypothetical protein
VEFSLQVEAAAVDNFVRDFGRLGPNDVTVARLHGCR